MKRGFKNMIQYQTKVNVVDRKGEKMPKKCKVERSTSILIGCHLLVFERTITDLFIYYLSQKTLTNAEYSITKGREVVLEKKGRKIGKGPSFCKTMRQSHGAH